MLAPSAAETVSADSPAAEVPRPAPVTPPASDVQPGLRVPTVELRGEQTADRDDVHADAQRMDIPAVVAHLMRARGVVDPDVQARMLNPRLAELRRPDAMAGFGAALDRIEYALATGETIGVFGDYDVDGCTTAAILSTYLEALGATVVVRVAHREHGYGLTLTDAKLLAEAGVGLVLTGDCGTSDVEALSWLQQRGIGRVVIDHHQVPERMPPADALINPHQDGCGFPFKGLCSAGVAFYLCAALRSRLANKRASVPDPRGWLDLVALATVCDMMPLHEENRILVAHGLRVLSRRHRPGIRALLSRAKVDPSVPIDETHLGFKLGPRLNAPGRLGSAMPSLSLLRARTDAEAAPIAQQIESINTQRKQHTEKTVVEAMALLAADRKLEQRAALTVYHHGWQAGVVGIAASGLTEQYGKPAMVIAVDREAGIARGSVRTFGKIDVRAALVECSDLLLRFGGHPQAAGVTVAPDKLDALTEAFDEAVARQGGHTGAGADIEVVDANVPLRRVDAGLVAAMRGLGPYGVGFSPPRFLAEDVRVDSAKVVGGRHVAMRLAQGDARLDCIAFGQGAHLPRPGDALSVVYIPFVDRFRGEDRLRLQVERFWRV